MILTNITNTGSVILAKNIEKVFKHKYNLMT